MSILEKHTVRVIFSLHGAFTTGQCRKQNNGSPFDLLLPYIFLLGALSKCLSFYAIQTYFCKSSPQAHPALSSTFLS